MNLYLMKRVLIILLLLVIVPVTTFAQQVREDAGSVKVYFRVGSTAIDEAYRNNGKSLNEFAEIINAYREDESVSVGKISIISSTSPDGGEAINARIAELRAKAITNWLIAKTSAELAYTVESMSTDWDMLIAAVEQRQDVPYKQEVLTIMRDTPEFVESNGRVISQRLNKLKTLRGSVPYSWLLRNIFPDMRYATATATIQRELPKTLTITTPSPMNFPYAGGSDVIKFEKSVLDGVLPTVTCDAEWISLVNTSETAVEFVVAESSIHESRSTIIVLNYSGTDYPVIINQEPAPEPTPEPTPEPVVEPTPELESVPVTTPTTSTLEKKPFYMAIKTNMLYDVAVTPNLAAEFYLGKNFSLSASYAHAWWKSEPKNIFWRYYGAEASFRWWFGNSSQVKPLQGHHVGLNYQILTYDFQFGNKGILAGMPGGMLIDRPSHIVALEYGYSVPIARRLNLDFVVGVGYNWGIFEEYLPIDDHYVWQATKQRKYVGPTKVEISLSWLLGYGNYNKNKGKGAKK